MENKEGQNQFVQESKQFWRPKNDPPKIPSLKDVPGIQAKLLQYVLAHAKKGDVVSTINEIDKFCSENWMMNLGPQKHKVIQHVFKNHKATQILQIGGYCGYSSLVFSHFSNAHIHTIEISQKFAAIARKIQEHAGVADRITIHIGTVETSEQYLKKNGPFDAIFIDHVKGLYLQDYKLMLGYGIVPKGGVVIGDNIICPGAPDYLQYFKHNKDYKSTLYHSYVQYSDIPDAVLVSYKLI